MSGSRAGLTGRPAPLYLSLVCRWWTGQADGGREPAAQNQKEVTINDQAAELDAGLTDKVDVALTGPRRPWC